MKGFFHTYFEIKVVFPYEIFFHFPLRNLFIPYTIFFALGWQSHTL